MKNAFKILISSFITAALTIAPFAIINQLTENTHDIEYCDDYHISGTNFFILFIILSIVICFFRFVITDALSKKLGNKKIAFILLQIVLFIIYFLLFNYTIRFINGKQLKSLVELLLLGTFIIVVDIIVNFLFRKKIN